MSGEPFGVLMTVRQAKLLEKEWALLAEIEKVHDGQSPLKGLLLSFRFLYRRLVSDLSSRKLVLLTELYTDDSRPMEPVDFRRDETLGAVAVFARKGELRQLQIQ